MDFKYLEHTADAKFIAYGESLEQAFSNSAKAMFTILIEPEKVNSVIKKEIKVSAKKTESLLYDFLEELIILLDTDGFLLSKIENLKIENNNLSCTVYGDSHKNYEISGDIKSVTYNDMSIIKKEKYEITVVVDL